MDVGQPEPNRQGERDQEPALEQIGRDERVRAVFTASPAAKVTCRCATQTERDADRGPDTLSSYCVKSRPSAARSPATSRDSLGPLAPYPIIADIASESTTIAGEIAASPELRLDPDQRLVATWTLEDGTSCLAYDGLAEHLAALDPIGPVICTGHLASVQTDREDGPIRTLIVDFVEHPPRTQRPSPSTVVPSSLASTYRAARATAPGPAARTAATAT